MAAKDEKLARAIAEAIMEINPELILLGLSGSVLISAAERIGLKTASEVFADREYQSDGTLVPRNRENAVIHDEDTAARRSVRMVKEGVVTSIDGKDIPIKADSICLHGDGEKAVIFAQRIHEELIREGIEITSIQHIIC